MNQTLTHTEDISKKVKGRQNRSRGDQENEVIGPIQQQQINYEICSRNWQNIENGNEIEILEQENMIGEIKKNGCV